jgi:thiaminase
MYGGEEFERDVEEFIAMVDAACQRIKAGAGDSEKEASAAKTELDEMQMHFFMSCKLEYMFWDQASIMMEWPKIGGT